MGPEVGMMTMKQRFEKIYGCDTRAQFPELSREKHSVELMKSLGAMVQVQPAVGLTPSRRLVLEFLKCHRKVGAIFSLPQGVFDQGIANSPEWVATFGAITGMEFAECLARRDLDATPVASSCFFQIIDPRPELKYQVFTPIVFLSDSS